MLRNGRQKAHFACSAIRLSAAAAAGMPSAAMRCRLMAILFTTWGGNVNQQPV
jgi:hypothetical protein